MMKEATSIINALNRVLLIEVWSFQTSGHLKTFKTTSCVSSNVKHLNPLAFNGCIKRHQTYSKHTSVRSYETLKTPGPRFIKRFITDSSRKHRMTGQKTRREQFKVIITDAGLRLGLLRTRSGRFASLHFYSWIHLHLSSFTDHFQHAFCCPRFIRSFIRFINVGSVLNTLGDTHSGMM